MVGIWCKSGSKIGRVCKSSPGFNSGITEEMTITHIQDNLQLGICSDDVNRTLQREWEKIHVDEGIFQFFYIFCIIFSLIF